MGSSPIVSTNPRCTRVGSEREWVREHPGARSAAGQDADELDGVDLDQFAVHALAELPPGRSFEDELEREIVNAV